MEESWPQIALALLVGGNNLEIDLKYIEICT